MDHNAATLIFKSHPLDAVIRPIIRDNKRRF